MLVSFKLVSHKLAGKVRERGLESRSAAGDKSFVVAFECVLFVAVVVVGVLFAGPKIFSE